MTKRRKRAASRVKKRAPVKSRVRAKPKVKLKPSRKGRTAQKRKAPEPRHAKSRKRASRSSSVRPSPKRPAKRSAPPPRRPRPKPHPQPQASTRPAPIVNTPYPATWFLSDYKTGSTRRGQLAYLRKTIQQLRSVYRGFSPKDGFDARYPQNWTAHQHSQVMAYGARLHSLMSAQHVIVRPRTKAEEKALRIHTQQKVPRQKAFVIHTSKPLVAAVHYVTQPEKKMPFFAPPIGGGLRVEMVQSYQDGALVLTDRDYLFEEMLGFQPYNPDDFIYALRMLLPLLPDKTPTGKEAMYTLLSREHGPIGTPVFKEFLIETLLDWLEVYEDEFAATLIGVRYQGDRWTAAMSPQSEYNQRQERRALYRKIREQDARDARKVTKPAKRKK